MNLARLPPSPSCLDHIYQRFLDGESCESQHAAKSGAQDISMAALTIMSAVFIAGFGLGYAFRSYQSHRRRRRHTLLP